MVGATSGETPTRGTQSLDADIAPAVPRVGRRLRLAMDLEGVSREIDDPALGDAGARVEAHLVFAIDPVRTVGDLDDQDRRRWVRVTVVARIAAYDGDVRLHLGSFVECDRQLRVDLPGVAQRSPQRRQHAPDPGRVATALRLADHRHAVDQLEALAVFETPRSIKRSYSARVQRRARGVASISMVVGREYEARRGRSTVRDRFTGAGAAGEEASRARARGRA